MTRMRTPSLPQRLTLVLALALLAAACTPAAPPAPTPAPAKPTEAPVKPSEAAPKPAPPSGAATTPAASSGQAAPAAKPTEPSAKPAAKAGPRDKLVVQLNWIRNSQFAGLFVAQEKGYYADENLEVEMPVGGPQINNVQVVIAGTAAVGITNPETIINARAQGADIRVLAATNQKNPSALACMPNANVKTPADLVGKKLGAAPGQRPTLETFLKTNNISPDQVEIVTTGVEVSQLIAGRIDCRVTFASDEPIALRQQGINPTVLLYADNGLPQQGNAYFVTGETLSGKSDLLVRWLRATQKGWAYAIANQAEATDIVVSKYGENLDRTQQAESFKVLAGLMEDDHSRQRGLLALNRATWEVTARVMLEQGKLTAPFDLTTLLAPAIFEQATAK